MLRFEDDFIILETPNTRLIFEIKDYVYDDPFDDHRFNGFIINDGDEALLFLCELIKGDHQKAWKCSGLDPNSDYEAIFKDQDNAPHIAPFVAKGALLQEKRNRCGIA